MKSFYLFHHIFPNYVQEYFKTSKTLLHDQATVLIHEANQLTLKQTSIIYVHQQDLPEYLSNDKEFQLHSLQWTIEHFWTFLQKTNGNTSDTLKGSWI